MATIDEIKDRIDIVEFINKYVPLQKSGRNHKGLCPFHTEKTASFYVFPDSNGWHCFGCGKGGDVFTFYMEHERCDFKEALSELARQAGVELKPLSPTEARKQSEQQRLLELMEDVADYYNILLMGDDCAGHARAYLRGRGITKDAVLNFRMGYAPQGWNEIRTYLLGKGYSLEEQIRAGVIVQREDGRTFDRFRNRVMIPICDKHGRVIAFGGRVLGKDETPKYMNSPQTELFSKGEVLFGLHNAVEAIKDKQESIIVEGYMDVIILHQIGYKNVVAPMGTALTEHHVKQLQKLTKRFVFALDSDSAGITGTLSGLSTTRQAVGRQAQARFNARGLVGYESSLDVDIRAIALPDGVDPDELVLKDKAQWEHLVQTSQPIVLFVFQLLLDAENYSEPRRKAQIVKDMLPLLLDVSNVIEREGYAQEIATRLGLNPGSVIAQMTSTKPQMSTTQQARPRDVSKGSLERYVLMQLITVPGLHEQVDVRLQELGYSIIVDQDFSGNMRIIWDAFGKLKANTETTWQDWLTDEPLKEVLQFGTGGSPETIEDQLVQDIIRSVMLIRKHREQRVLKQLYALISQQDNDAGTYGQLLSDVRNHSALLQGLDEALCSTGSYLLHIQGESPY